MAGKLKAKPKAAAPAPVRVLETPLARLVRRERINTWEHTAADEIMAAHAMEAGLPVRRDASLGLPIAEPRPHAADDAAARRSDLVTTLVKWRADLKQTWAYAVTLRVLIDEQTLTAVDTYCGWRKGKALTHLLVGLRHYAALRGNVPRGVRGWKYVPQTEQEAA